MIAATTLLLCSRRLPNRAIRTGEGILVLVGLLGGDSYLDSSQIMGSCHGRLWTLERTFLGSPEGSTKVYPRCLERQRLSFYANFGIGKKSSIWKEFSLPKTYRNSAKLGDKFMDDPG